MRYFIINICLIVDIIIVVVVDIIKFKIGIIYYNIILLNIFFLFRWIRITVLDISLNFLKFFHTRKLLGFKTIKPFRISCIIYIFYSIRNMILKLFSFKRINILVIFWFILNRLFFLFRAKRSIRHRNHFINRNIWLLIKFLKFNLYTRI